MTSEICETASEAIVKGGATLTTETAKRGLSEGIASLELIEKGFIPGIKKVGDMFDMGAIFIQGLMLAAKAMQNATACVRVAKELIG